MRTFAIPNEKNGSNAEIAQLVEHNLAKVRVASSSLVFRSKTSHLRMTFVMKSPDEVQLYMQSFSYRDGFFLLYRYPYNFLPDGFTDISSFWSRHHPR